MYPTPYYSFYPRYTYYRPYHYYPAYYGVSYQQNLLNSQISTVNQNMYNAGFMAGVTQSAVSNNIMY